MSSLTMILTSIGGINLLANTWNLKYSSFLVLIWTFYCMSAWSCDAEKNETAKHCWERDCNFDLYDKKVLIKESKLISREMKYVIHYRKIMNHVIKKSYTLIEIWLPNLRKLKFLNTSISFTSVCNQKLRLYKLIIYFLKISNKIWFIYDVRVIVKERETLRGVLKTLKSSHRSCSVKKICS